MVLRTNSPQPGKGKTPPPEETHQEAAYLRSLGERQVLVTVTLLGGEKVSGWIEYYDKDMVRLTREGEPNLFIFKHEIAHIAETGGTLNGLPLDEE
jgi:host factor-I protein